MILIIDICKEKLHAYEFVKPVENIVKKLGLKYAIKHYTTVDEDDLANFDKAIICGTSLKDNDFMEHLDKFSWIKQFNKPVFGICGGSHIIGLLLKHKKTQNKEIGFKIINVDKEFLGVKGTIEVYHLHQLQVLPEIFHEKNFYATLFHPEVRNPQMIERFLKL